MCDRCVLAADGGDTSCLLRRSRWEVKSQDIRSQEAGKVLANSGCPFYRPALIVTLILLSDAVYKETTFTYEVEARGLCEN